MAFQITRPEATKSALELLCYFSPYQNNVQMTDLTPKLRAFCAESEEVRGYAQRGFVAYCRCVYMAKDKKTFQISNYKLDKYAASLGLAKSPRLRFLERDKKVMTAMKGKVRFYRSSYSFFCIHTRILCDKKRV